MKFDCNSLLQDLDCFDFNYSKIQDNYEKNARVKQYMNSLFVNTKKYQIDQILEKQFQDTKFFNEDEVKSQKFKIDLMRDPKRKNIYKSQKYQQDNINNLSMLNQNEFYNNDNSMMYELIRENTQKKIYFKILDKYDFTDRDIENLCNDCLNDRSINFFTSFVQDKQYYKQFKKQFPDILQQNQFVIFSTFFSLIITNLLIRNLSKDILIDRLSYIWQKDKFNLTSKKYIFFPIHYDKSHWNLFLIRGFKKLFLTIKNQDSYTRRLLKFYFYDSLPCSQIQVLYEKLQLILEVILNGFLIKNKIKIKNYFELNHKNCKLIIVNVPQQDNNIDCGVYMLENIERTILQRYKIVQTNEINYQQKIIQEKRQIIHQLIKELDRKNKQEAFKNYKERMLNLLQIILFTIYLNQ